MVGWKLVGGSGQHNSAETTRQRKEACKPSSVSCPAMASCDRNRSELAEGKNLDAELGDCSLDSGQEQQLGEELGRLSLEKEDVHDLLDGGCTETDCSSECKGTSDCDRKQTETLPAKDHARNLEQRGFAKAPSKKRFFDRTKDSRPMSLAVLNQMSGDEFRRPHPGSAEVQFSRQSDNHHLRNGYYLPTSLVSSPHSIESRNLDPNAREFTPCFSCPASPGAHHHQTIPLAPLSYPLSAPSEMAQVAYNADMGAPCFPLPPYAAGGPVCFGAAVCNTWDCSNVGVGIPSGGTMPPGCRPGAPPIVFGPQSAHVSLLPMAFPHPSPSGQLFCIPGVDSSSVPDSSQPNSARSPLWKEHTSRSLLLTGVVAYASEVQLRKDLECWGPLRALELERHPDGIVIAHFYDLRHAREALKDIQNQHLLKQQLYHHLPPNKSPSCVPHQTDVQSSDLTTEEKKCNDIKCREDETSVGRRGLLEFLVQPNRFRRHVLGKPVPNLLTQPFVLTSPHVSLLPLHPIVSTGGVAYSEVFWSHREW